MRTRRILVYIWIDLKMGLRKGNQVGSPKAFDGIWAADDEFRATIHFLFDPTIEHHLALDTIWGLARVITFKLLEF